MGQVISFGDWVRRRRVILELTQADLAGKVSISLSMLRKIERDERRPSDQLAGLLADHLAIDDAQRAAFMQLARGKFVPEIPEPGTLAPALAGVTVQAEAPAPFVARERQLGQMREYIDRALQGQSGMVFVSGEAGQGKTSLLTAFACQAVQAYPELIAAGGSSDVFTGQGDPLLPFRDIFRLLTGDVENAGMPALITPSLAARLGEAVPDIIEILLENGPHLAGTLLPDAALEASLTHSFADHPKSIQLLLQLKAQRRQAAQELRQERLFEEISSTLKALAQRWPLLLVLDDLHWIDPSSAALLGHLAVRLTHSRILILGGYRPEELAHQPDGQLQHPLREVLSESLRRFGHNRIDLDQSSPAEALGFVNALLDLEENTFSETFRQHLTAQTEGHPLFVVELLRDMREMGDIVQGPGGAWQESEAMSWASFPAMVEGVIEKRVARLPAELRRLLSAACVQGETFYAEVIARVCEDDPRELAQQLSEELDRQHRLVRAQGVWHAGMERLSHYQFRHHLIQRYLYDRLSDPERMYLHEAVGNALESLFASSLNADDLPASQLARHFEEAHMGEKASRYLLIAGQKADRVLSFDEAAAFFERGMNLLDGLADTPDVRRLVFDLSLALAHALWNSGRVKTAVTAYEKAIEAARALEDPDVLALAVLAYEEPRWRLNMDAGSSQKFMREALVLVGEEASALRVRLLVGLSRTMMTVNAQEELRTTVDQALEIARQINDPVALFDALRIKIQINRSPETIAERVTLAKEMIVLSESIVEQERLADALDLTIYDLLELGEIEQLDLHLKTLQRVVEEIRQPFQMHHAMVMQTMRAILRGKFELADRLANQAADFSQQIGVADMDGILGIHMFTIRREQGRIHEVAPIVKLVVSNNPQSNAWRPGLALILSVLNQQEACREVFEGLAAGGFASVPRDSLWVSSLAYLSEVCAYLRDSARAADLYSLLLPYDGRAVVLGGATVCYGAAARYLGMLAGTMADWESAERHFTGALALDQRMGAWPWLAHSQFEYAGMLLERGLAGDREHAAALLEEAASAAQRLGMVYLGQKTTHLQTCYQLNLE